MPFDYYENLSASQKAIYRKSDSIEVFELKLTLDLKRAVDAVRVALETERTRKVNAAVTRLTDILARELDFKPVSVKVLARRPTSSGEELHGIYEREEGRESRIKVWMRTAKHKRVVTFRTFLRTLLHELCHHIDYELLGLTDTFHTEGFFKRESSLMRTLAPPELKAKAKTKPRQKAESNKKPVSKPKQLSLFDEIKKM